MEKINSTVISISGLNQWTSNTDVIKWFENIDRKSTMKFIQLDVENFYPSITEELLMSAINWARQFLDITDQDVEIIMQ